MWWNDHWQTLRNVFQHLINQISCGRTHPYKNSSTKHMLKLSNFTKNDIFMKVRKYTIFHFSVRTHTWKFFHNIFQSMKNIFNICYIMFQLIFNILWHLKHTQFSKFLYQIKNWIFENKKNWKNHSNDKFHLNQLSKGVYSPSMCNY